MTRRLLAVAALIVLLSGGLVACATSSPTTTRLTALASTSTASSGMTGPTASASSTSQASAVTPSSGTAQGKELVVYAVGDDTQPGNESVSHRLANLVPLPSQGLDLFIYLGDVRMTGSPADFQRYDSIWGRGGHDLRAKTASLIGNHETGSLETGWVPYWSGTLITPWLGSLTQTSPPYYTVKLGTWKFIILDTTTSLAGGRPQYDFLVKELQEPGYRSIVCGHYPRWSNGLHGDDGDLDAAWRAMCTYGAVAYLSGHDHGSQVQPPRDGSGTVVSSGGCIQLVAAAGGAPLYPFVTGAGHAAATWKDDTHFALLRLTLGDKSLVADFMADDGKLLHSQTLALSQGN